MASSWNGYVRESFIAGTLTYVRNYLETWIENFSTELLMQILAHANVTAQLDSKSMGIAHIAMAKPPAEQQASSIKSHANIKVANAST